MRTPTHPRSALTGLLLVGLGVGAMVGCENPSDVSRAFDDHAFELADVSADLRDYRREHPTDTATIARMESRVKVLTDKCNQLGRQLKGMEQ